MSGVPSPFAISPDGGFLVCADGPELLVYGGNGAPAWKHFCDDILAGVVATHDQVIAVDASGNITRWRRDDGLLLDSQRVGGAPKGLACSSDGVLAILMSAGVAIVRPTSAPQRIGVDGAVTLAFGPDSGSLGVGTATGNFVALDTSTGGAWGTVQLPADRVGGVAWSMRGSWVVAAGADLYLVQGDGQAAKATLAGPGGPLGTVVCAAEGIVAAVVCGDDQVAAFDLHAQRAAGELNFRKREVGQIAMGPGAMLGIGLDDGDATLVDLVSGTLGRTEPHPGRGRNVWRLDDKIEHGILRGALAFHRAGAEPIARYIPRPDPQGPAQGGWMGACLGCFGMTGVIFAVCAGIMLLMYVIYAFGLWDAIPIR